MYYLPFLRMHSVWYLLMLKCVSFVHIWLSIALSQSANLCYFGIAHVCLSFVCFFYPSLSVCLSLSSFNCTDVHTLRSFIIITQCIEFVSRVFCCSADKWKEKARINKSTERKSNFSQYTSDYRQQLKLTFKLNDTKKEKWIKSRKRALHSISL